MSCAAPVARGYFQAGQLYMAGQLPLEPWFGWEVKRRERPLDWKAGLSLRFAWATLDKRCGCGGNRRAWIAAFNIREGGSRWGESSSLTASAGTKPVFGVLSHGGAWLYRKGFWLEFMCCGRGVGRASSGQHDS